MTWCRGLFSCLLVLGLAVAGFAQVARHRPSRESRTTTSLTHRFDRNFGDVILRPVLAEGPQPQIGTTSATSAQAALIVSCDPSSQKTLLRMTTIRLALTRRSRDSNGLAEEKTRREGT